MQAAAIEVKNLTVQQGDATILDDVSFSIPEGSISVIVGPNGSGKTTLIRTLLGLQKGVKGSVSVLGKSPANIREKLGYVPQIFSLDRTVPMTVREFMLLAGGTDDYVTTLLKHVGLTDKHTRMIGLLSGGEVQRLLLARSLIRKPAILFLDEPESSVDVAGTESFYKLLQHIHQSHVLTSVIVTHELDLVHTFASQVLCLNKKLVCHGKPQEVLTKDVLTELYGHDIGLYHHHL